MSDGKNYKWAAVRFYNNKSKVNKESTVEISKIIKFNPEKLYDDYIVLQKASDGTEYEAAAQLLILGERREDIENKKDVEETDTRTRYNNKKESTVFQEIIARNKVDYPKVETDEEEEDEDDGWVPENRENHSKNTKKRTRPKKKSSSVTFYDPQQVEIITEKIKSLSEVQVSFERPSKKSSASEVQLGQQLQLQEKNDDQDEYDLEIQREILKKKLELIELELKAKKRHDKIQFANPPNSPSKLKIDDEFSTENLPSCCKNVQPIKDSKYGNNPFLHYSDIKYGTENNNISSNNGSIKSDVFRTTDATDEFDNDDLPSIESFQRTNDKSINPSSSGETNPEEKNESKQGTSQIELRNKRSISSSSPPSKRTCSAKMNMGEKRKRTQEHLKIRSQMKMVPKILQKKFL